MRKVSWSAAVSLDLYLAGADEARSKARRAATSSSWTAANWRPP
jgi:hypothetical protein